MSGKKCPIFPVLPLDVWKKSALFCSIHNNQYNFFVIKRTTSTDMLLAFFESCNKVTFATPQIYLTFTKKAISEKGMINAILILKIYFVKVNIFGEQHKFLKNHLFLID